jgi:CRP-like cAMP-binding protein
MEPRKPEPLQGKKEEDLLTVSSLRFKKGDLVMKEGDYGISIYRILSGKVRVYTETETTETLLSVLGPGDMMGEMIFLSSKSFQKRSASARAMEDCELELIHPNMLAKEYEQMPVIIKLLADQCVARLLRMNQLAAQLTHKKSEQEKKARERGNIVNRRAHFRKKVRMPVECRPAGYASPHSMIAGEIRDISLGGVGMEIRPQAFSRFPYQQGEEFKMDTTLPNNKPISFLGRLVWSKQGSTPGPLFLGMNIAEMGEGDRKELGFSMMTA